MSQLDKNSSPNTDKPALPKKWIVPIRLAVYVVLAACSAYIYFNARDLELTHLFIFLPVVAVAAMALLDCRFSENYWKQQQQQPGSESS
ncbi:MAG: hypothetical protein PVF34_08645 [Gammaproteobacteria bacterium]|jgi:hypothetical protein